jgi:hypothetical protein
MLFHPGAAGLAPVTFESPPVELGDRHEGDCQEPTGQMRPVRLGARIVFKEVGYDIGVHDYCGGRSRGHL